MIAMRIRFHFFSIIFMCIGLLPEGALAQRYTPDSIPRLFDVYRQHTLQEKIYVHVDRTFYVTGEIAWFKVYVTDASLHKPLDVSKVAYAEILDTENGAVLQAKIQLTKGSGSGSFFLPAVLASGTYRLRVYTQWMRNFSPDFYFQQTITLINPFTGGSPRAVVIPDKSYTLQFYPEGGHLVDGMRSRIAFHVRDALGVGANVRGAVLNSGGDTVVRFSPSRFGIGDFYMTPQAGQHYRAVLKTGKLQSSAYELPSIQPGGYGLLLTDSTESYLYVYASRHGLASAAASVYLFVHARQLMVHAEARFLKNDSAVFAIRKADLPAGIVHFTLFTEKLEPVCERLYFRYPEHTSGLSVVSDQPAYGIRRKVTISLKATEDGRAVSAGDVSVAVYRLDSLTIHPQEGIDSYLLLTSDLGGTPESVGYYFQERTDAVIAAMDKLMLTYGWRRFRWDKVLTGTYGTKHLAEYRGHIIHGRVVNDAGLPNAGIVTYLSAPGKVVRLHSVRSDAHGDVYFEVKDFTGPRRLVVQPDLRLDSLYRVEIRDPFSNAFTTQKLPALSLLAAGLEPALRTRSIGMQVNSIYQAEGLSMFRRTVSDSLGFYGHADEVYFLDAYTRFQVMEEVMREYVPGVLVRKRRDGFHFLLLDDVHHSAFQDDPMILLDGVPVFDTDRIMAFDPLKIRKLEVVTRKYYLGPAVFPGIVSYSTYGGDLGGFELDPHCVVLDYEGLQQRREFYSPLYETERQRSSRMADQRSLLYWASSVEQQADGTALATFYTSDVPGRYEVRVEGFTSTGAAVSARHAFLVKRFDD